LDHAAHPALPHYGRFALMIGASFVAMFVLMYAMVDTFADVYPNINQVYMAGLMSAAMVVIEIGVMGSMYPNKRLNTALLAGGVVLLAAFWLLTREQTAVGDRQFLKSMIPHHSGAVLMCQRANLHDPEIVTLCRQIVASQRAEIDQMNRLLAKGE
jgi:uncharacterized protein (DUF305 family)